MFPANTAMENKVPVNGGAMLRREVKYPGMLNEQKKPKNYNQKFMLKLDLPCKIKIIIVKIKVSQFIKNAKVKQQPIVPMFPINFQC